MKRSLIKGGNNSYSLTIPKTWVEKNNLSAKTDLTVIENGSNLIISTQIIREQTYREMVFDNEPEDAILAVISNLYNEGHSKIKISLSDKCIYDINKIEKYASNLFGITVEKTERVIYLVDNCDNRKCPEFIKKCFQNILILTRHFNEKPKDHLWYNQIFDGYQRTFFMAEYIARLVHIEESSDTKMALRYSASAWSFECIVFLLKRIAEHEIEHVKDTRKFELENIFQSVYNVCYKDVQIVEFYNAKSEYEKYIMAAHYDSVMRENLMMFSYMCAKLVKQYSSK